MAGLSERALEASLRALVERDRQLAYSVILRDQYLDEMETELNRLCLEFLVRQQPVAGQLRFVFTTIQINKELERIGDYAETA
jgi:phosphate transport system protein